MRVSLQSETRGIGDIFHSAPLRLPARLADSARLCSRQQAREILYRLALLPDPRRSAIQFFCDPKI